jgi:hypothetical protein
MRRTICFSKTKQMHDLVIGLFINRYEFGCCPMELWGTTGNRISLYISKAYAIPCGFEKLFMNQWLREFP